MILFYMENYCFNFVFNRWKKQTNASKGNDTVLKLVFNLGKSGSRIFVFNH